MYRNIDNSFDYRPTYDTNLPLSGYIVSSAGRLSSSAASIQKQVEQLGGTYQTKIDDTVGIVISSQGILNLLIFLLLLFNLSLKMKFKS